MRPAGWNSTARVGALRAAFTNGSMFPTTTTGAAFRATKEFWCSACFAVLPIASLSNGNNISLVRTASPLPISKLLWQKIIEPGLSDSSSPNALLSKSLHELALHKEPHVKAWLAKHPRFHCHFIPTSSSWLNLVERWFAEISEKAIRNGSFVSVQELENAIQEFLEAWNKSPRPFVWTAKVEDIMAKLDRARRKLEEIKPGCTTRRTKKNVEPIV